MKSSVIIANTYISRQTKNAYFLLLNQGLLLLLGELFSIMLSRSALVIFSLLLHIFD